ncbi:MAG: hypothetical protein AAFO15_02450, partial [Pseudomonadota bacterium]
HKHGKCKHKHGKHKHGKCKHKHGKHHHGKHHHRKHHHKGRFCGKWGRSHMRFNSDIYEDSYLFVRLAFGLKDKSVRLESILRILKNRGFTVV